VIPYTIGVVNAGNVTIFSATVTDPNAVLGTCTPTIPVAVLLPGEMISCPATHAVTQADLDAGAVGNTATASGTPAGGGSVSGSASVLTPVLRQPDLRLVKTADIGSVSAAGQTITYTVTATNIGNVTLAGVSVTDANATISSCTPTLPVASLAPAADVVCTATHVATQADVDAGSIVNVAQSTGTAPDGATLTRSANVTTTAVRSPGITTSKSAGTLTYSAVGDTVAFTITVGNTGNVTLTGVAVTDTNATIGICTPAVPVATLAPGASISCAATHVATQADLDAGHVDNLATSSGTEPAGATVSDDSPTVVVPAVQSPELTATKTTSATSYSAVGQVLTYTIGVTNTGNVTISVVSLFDANASIGACTPGLPVAALVPGGAVSCAAQHTITQDDLDAGHFDNLARATGLDPFGGSVTDDSPVVTTPAVQSPSLDTTKSASTLSVSAVGDAVAFTVTTTNTGNVTLFGATITDSNAVLGTCTPAVPVARLAPGGSISCSATHATTQAELDAGHVDNGAGARQPVVIVGGGEDVVHRQLRGARRRHHLRRDGQELRQRHAHRRHRGRRRCSARHLHAGGSAFRSGARGDG
jgi:hypothetical protein